MERLAAKMGGTTKFPYNESLTWVNDQVRIAIICLQQLPFLGPFFNTYCIKVALNNNHLSAMATCHQRPQFWVSRVVVVKMFTAHSSAHELRERVEERLIVYPLFLCKLSFRQFISKVTKCWWLWGNKEAL